MWDGAFGAIRDFGAFVGLLTGALVLYDRAIRKRPFATVALNPGAQPLDPGDVVLRINNPSDRPILVEIEPAPDSIVGLTRGIDTKQVLAGAIRGQRRESTKAAIGGGATLELAFMRLANFEDVGDSRQVAFCIKWKFAQASWLPTWPVRIAMSKANFERLERSVASPFEQGFDEF